MKSPIFRTYEVFAKSRFVPCPRKIRNVDVTPFTGRTLWTRENAEWHHVDTDSGTVIRDVYLGTDRFTEGVLGIRRTAPKVSVHMFTKGTLGIRSVAPEFGTCDATKPRFVPGGTGRLLARDRYTSGHVSSVPLSAQGCT